MQMNVMEYKGYFARIEFDGSAGMFHGRVVGMRDVVDFYGASVEELTRAFHEAVDDYLAWCKKDGIKPEKSWHGKLTYRPGDELSHRLLIAAAIANKSINEYMNDVLDTATREVVDG
jgi:predicted HicB family RNase H-like nuclease